MTTNSGIAYASTSSTLVTSNNWKDWCSTSSVSNTAKLEPTEVYGRFVKVTSIKEPK